MLDKGLIDLVLSIVKNIKKTMSVNHDRFNNFRLFMVQHLLEDTKEWLIDVRDCGIEVDVVIGIEYSAKESVVNELLANNFHIYVPPFEKIQIVITDLLHDSLNRCKIDGKKLIIVEVGGYAVPILHQKFSNFTEYCAGAIEETKQGLWRDMNLPEIKIPIFQIADTRFKKLESLQVGDAVVEALGMALRSKGVSLAGKKVCVLGYGWIGSAISQILRNRRAIIYCYDSDPIQNIKAYLAGFNIGPKKLLLTTADIVIGATGQTSLDANDIIDLKDGAYLASASSRDIELDLKGIKNIISSTKDISKNIKELKLKNKRSIYIIGSGFPINFLLEKSVSYEVMDLIFSCALICISKLCLNSYDPKIYVISEEEERKIAELWVDYYIS